MSKTNRKSYSVCAVKNCFTRCYRGSKGQMFSVPESPSLKNCYYKRQLQRRNEWLRKIGKEGCNEKKKLRICFNHFLSGKPAGFFDYDSPDWVPSQNLGQEDNIAKIEKHITVKEEPSEIIDAEQTIQVLVEETSNTTSVEETNTSHLCLNWIDIGSQASTLINEQEEGIIQMQNDPLRDSSSPIHMIPDGSTKDFLESTCSTSRDFEQHQPAHHRLGYWVPEPNEVYPLDEFASKTREELISEIYLLREKLSSTEDQLRNMKKDFCKLLHNLGQNASQS